MDIYMEDISDEEVESLSEISVDGVSDLSDGEPLEPNREDADDNDNEENSSAEEGASSRVLRVRRRASYREMLEQLNSTDNDEDNVETPKALTPERTSHAEESKSKPSPSPKGGFDDDGQTCTICFEQWTSSSEHRLVSLRCGHLFGRSCITRWLKGQNARCPQCNARARKSEIRNIYARAVKVIDSSERDRALQDLQKEQELRRKFEMEATQERLKYTLASKECERLKKELMSANKLLQEYRCGIKGSESSQASKSKVPIYSLEKCLDIAKNGGCRIVDVCELLGMLLISQPSVNELFPGYGFRKISTLDMKPSEFVWVHQKPIKDMAFHVNDGLVLTASLDKSVKITNVLSNTVVQTYSVESDVWSCKWDADDPLYFFAGLKSGATFLFDIRMTSSHVRELPAFGSKTPVVSVEYLRNATSASYRTSGPIVGKLSDCAFYEKLNSVGEYKVAPLPALGPCNSLSSEPASGHFLVSCRPTPKQPRVSHTLCEFVTETSGGLICNPIQTIFGGRTQAQLTKSKLLLHPDKESSLLICAGDEEANGALIWDGCSGNCLSHLKTDSPVLDLAGMKINHKSFLTALTDKSLRVYSWMGEE
ncbi:E3 ubiquitin-protein ligase RFWD3-like [Uloborus diversus]|uniref:E3 ubiquitin-protein ligase RFWD3-like n=1 Tax=Uloborus diversus TaxID=327109 RepID=UPI002409E68E|nr:E3 ubiquitin-protein ligase RFWD3-like [Uloborus diversus]